MLYWRRRQLAVGIMEPWIVGTKLLILACVAAGVAMRGTGPGALFVILVLGHVSAASLSHLVRPRQWRIPLLFAGLCVSAAGALLVDPLFASLVPLAAAELLYAFTSSRLGSLLPALVVAAFVPRQDLVPYSLAAAFAMTSFLMAVQAHARIAALGAENERLHASNAALRREADANEGRRGQLDRLARLEERGRLAQDVHDRVGHAMTGSIIQLEAASAILDEDPRAARAMMMNGVRALREGLDGIRATLRGIKPLPAQIGVRSIQVMLDEAAAKGDVAMRLSHAGDLGVVTRAQWGAIRDNVRECLTNTLTHSQAREIRVSIEVMNRLVKVEARDDGRGACSFQKGLGLQGMEERAVALGGALIVDGSRGFSVITVLPIASDGGAGHAG
jgi:signal transduction histidine kinase